MKLSKKTKTILLIALVLIVVMFPTITYAATTADLKFCEYGGTRRVFKTLGMILFFVKIIVPLIIIITASISFLKPVISGKDDDIKGSLAILVKKCIAGIIIGLIPTILDYTMDTLVGYDDSSFTACSKCLLDPDSCVIPDEDPDTYEED